MLADLMAQVENSPQLAPLPRMAAMTQDVNDQHMAAYQNELNQAGMEWTVKASNTTVWSSMGAFIILVIAFIAFLIRKKTSNQSLEDSGHRRRENTDDVVLMMK